MGRLLAEKTGAEIDKEGRIVVQPDLTVPGHPELFFLGDLAQFEHQGGNLAGCGAGGHATGALRRRPDRVPALRPEFAPIPL